MNPQSSTSYTETSAAEPREGRFGEFCGGVRSFFAHPPGARGEKAERETLWAFVKPYAIRHRGPLLAALLLNAVPGFGIAFQTVAPKYLLDEVLMAPRLSAATRGMRLALLICGYLFAGLVLRMSAWYASYKLFTAVREQITMEMRSKFFRHINNLCLRFHSGVPSGELFSYVLGSPLAGISSFFHLLCMNVPNALATSLVSILWIASWDWSQGLVLGVSVLATVFVSRTGSDQLRRLEAEFQQAEGEVAGRVSDIFRGNRDVKMYGIEERMSETFDKNADVLRCKVYERDLKTHQVNMRQESVSYFCFALVCLVGSWRFMGHHLTGGQLLAYLGAFVSLQAPVGLLFQIGAARGAARASMERLNRLAAASSSTPEPRYPEAVPQKADLLVRNLTFRYVEEPVFEDLHLHIPHGQKVAFVGVSGSGKSTLAKLLLRLYDPDAGSVCLGGIDLRRFNSADLRRRFGVVPQDPYFFNTTIRNNLLIVSPEATEEHMEAVCRKASAWDFIRALPRELDTVIGEGGCRLSAGQRQRLAIARALLNDPAYFIFDEATSALDTVSERMVQDALAHCLGTRTAIFIAHRLATIRNCDRILVLGDRGIVQDGSFAELMSQPGLFARMVERNRF